MEKVAIGIASANEYLARSEQGSKGYYKGESSPKRSERSPGSPTGEKFDEKGFGGGVVDGTCWELLAVEESARESRTLHPKPISW